MQNKFNAQTSFNVVRKCNNKKFMLEMNVDHLHA